MGEDGTWNSVDWFDVTKLLKPGTNVFAIQANNASGGAGIVMQMNPDGSNMQRLTHGLRVPYSFEYDPFGQLWLLSNGQGNPNRFVRVIDGVDYHCYSRSVPNDWLTGKHPLSPPCFELPSGARTQRLRYYGAALWTLLRIDSPSSRAAIASGAKHPDWRVRRLAVNILRRYQPPQAASVATILSTDSSPAVRVEAALALDDSRQVSAALLDASKDGAAEDAHLRYEAAWHLAKHANPDVKTLRRLLNSDDEKLRLTGLITLDIACYETFESRAHAEQLLAKTLVDPGSLPINYLKQGLLSFLSLAIRAMRL